MSNENSGIKVDLKIAMDEAQDILNATQSLDNLIDNISDRYEDVFNKSSENVKKFLNTITEETKSTQKVLSNINAGKDLFTIDPKETKKSLEQARRITIDSMKDLSRYLEENNLKIAQQLGLDPESAEYKQVVTDGIKSYKQYLGDVAKGIQTELGNMPDTGKGGTGDLGHQFGVYFLSHLIGSSLGHLAKAYMVAPIGVEAAQYQREKTAFDIRSAPGMFQTQKMLEIQNIMAQTELSAMQTQSKYMTIGQLGGAGLGMLAGSLVPGIGTVAGGFIGSQLGELVGGTLGGLESEEMKAKTIKENALRQAHMMRSLQMYQLMEQYAQSFQQYDVAKGLFGARFGSQGVGGSGIGYNLTELQNLAYGQASITGSFDRGTFNDQLNFSRAFGYKPEDIFQAGFSTRYTNQQVGSSELLARQNLANQTGMGSRMPELINSMNQLTVSMTQLTGMTDESNLLRFSSLPSMLFGSDNAYGRLSDLGLPMLQRLNSAMMPEMGSVQSIELLRSYAQGMQRRGESYGLSDLMGRMQQGIFGEGNIQDLLTTATEKSGGNKNMFRAYMNAMTGLNYKQIGLIQDQLEKAGGDTPQEQINNWAKNWEENIKELQDPTEKSAEYLKKLAEEHTPTTLKYLESINNEMIKIGATTYEKVLSTTLEVTKIHAEILKDQTELAQIVKQLLDSFNQYKTNPTGEKYGPPERHKETGVDFIPMPNGTYMPIPRKETFEDMTNFFSTLKDGIVGVFESVFIGPDLRNLNPKTTK